MAKTDLLGPFDLGFDTIKHKIRPKHAGVFALGYTDAAGSFRISHVGRSDADLRSSLINLIGCGLQFKYRLYGSPQAAFEKECALFHTFHPAGNRLHPERPVGTNWRCPQCLSLAGRP
jgi:hypothetical protein